MPLLPRASLLLCLVAAPVAAAETPWQTVAPGVTMRLVSSGTIKPDGTTWLGVELDMPQTSKTYWRIPGETGLPTELDFAGSQGIAAEQIVWPYPERDQDGRYLDYVYRGPTLLPVQLRLDRASAQVEVAVVMGVCSDICVPAQAKFSLPLDGTKDMPNGLRIRQAMALAPIAWDGSAQPIGDVHYRQADQMLAVRITDPLIDPNSLIAATDDGEPLFGAPQKSPEPDLVLLPILGTVRENSLENRAVQLTFTTAMGAYELTRPIQAAE